MRGLTTKHNTVAECPAVILSHVSPESAPSPPSWSSTAEQGLTLVHFSAQPEPFLTQKHTLNTLITP